MLFLIHTCILVKKYFVSRVRDHHTLIFIQVCLFLVSVLLVMFLRLTKPMRRSGAFKASTLNTLWTYDYTGDSNNIRIGYAPKTDATTAIVKEIQERFLASFRKVKLSFEGFSTEIHLINSYCLNDSIIEMAVVFRDMTNPSNINVDSNTNLCQVKISSTTWASTEEAVNELPRHLEVAIRPHPTHEVYDYWQTHSMFPTNQSYCEWNALKGYTTRGVTILLQFVVEAIIKYRSPTTFQYSLSIKGIDCQQEWIDPLQKSLGLVMPVVMSASYFPSALIVAWEIIKENNVNMKRTLSLLGVHEIVYTLSWVLCVVMEILVISAVTTAVFFLPGEMTALTKSDPGVLFVLSLSYGLALMSISAWITNVVFPDGPAAYVILLVCIVQTGMVMYNTIHYDETNASETLLLNFFINYILDLGCCLIIKHEETGQGVTWNSFLMPPTTQDKRSVSMCMLMLFIHTSGNIAIMLAHANIGSLRQTATDIMNIFLVKIIKIKKSQRKYKLFELQEKTRTSSNYSEEDISSETFLNFCYETKSERSSKCQPRQLYFKVYNNKTTALLGYPETEFSDVTQILSGQKLCTSSNVTICGVPLKNYLETHPTYLGVCSQQSSMFEDLSIKENIELFVQLKGLNQQVPRIETNEIVTKCGLDVLLNATTGDLSLFWSRILILALAALGEPQILLIEDPLKDFEQVHSKMMLQVLKYILTSRTCLVTTTCAETAFLLADKIAVNIKGSTVCFGSQEFVEHCFGAGYRLETTLCDGCNVNALVNYMQLFVPMLLVLERSESQLICLLPKNIRHMFEFLLSNLRMKDVAFKIHDCMINDIRMNDLLLKLKDYDSALTHLHEVDKYRSATDVFSLKSLTESSPWPKVLYSALVKTSSGRFSLMNQQYLETTTGFNQSFGQLNMLESNNDNPSSLQSMFRNLNFISKKKHYLQFPQGASTNVDIEETQS